MSDFLTKYQQELVACPAAGSGVHAWVMRIANYAFFAGVPDAEAEGEIVRAMSRAQNPHNEVAVAIKKAREDHPNWVPAEAFKPGTAPAVAAGGGGVAAAAAQVVMLPEVARALIDAAGGDIDGAKWRGVSPMRIPEEPAAQTEAVLGALYGDAEFLFVGERYGKEVRTALEWQERAGGPPTAGRQEGGVGPYVIPNPLDGEEHVTGGGVKSRRCDAAVARWAFAVAEMDEMPIGDQLRFWWAWRRTPQLEGSFPIVALVYSGGKSVHAWLAVDAEDAEAWKREVYGRLFGKVLIPLGCDRTCRNSSRLSRLAGVPRADKGGAIQALYYLNPGAHVAGKSLGERVAKAVEFVGQMAAGVKAAAEGAKGAGKGRGRPAVSKDIAFAFFSSLGFPVPLRYWHDAWYRQRGGRYRAVSDGTVFCEVMAYLHRHWPKNATQGMVANVMAHGRADDTCAVPADWAMPCWLGDGRDASCWRAMGNQLVDIEAAARGELCTRPWDANLFSLLGSDYNYDPAATCPRWMQYLDEVLPRDEDKRMLQLMFGLALVPDTSYDVFFILYGDGGTGKTVAAEVLEMMLGEENVAHLDIADLNEKHAAHMLSETLVNVTSEVPAKLNALDLSNAEAQLKRAASGEKVKCERKNKDPYFSPCIARMIILTNSLPWFSDVSGGLWRRVRLIPFEVKQVDKETTDLRLADKLRAELPGIFNWAIQGLGILRTEYRAFPQLGRGAEIIAEHRQACDKERVFLEGECKVKAGEWAVAPDLYNAYKDWCEENGYKHKGANVFAQDVRRVFPGAVYTRQRRGEDRFYSWLNIRRVVPVADLLEGGDK